MRANASVRVTVSVEVLENPVDQLCGQIDKVRHWCRGSSRWRLEATLDTGLDFVADGKERWLVRMGWKKSLQVA